MAILPDTRLALLEFCEYHIPVFTTNALAIGLTNPQITAMSALATTMRSRLTAQQLAKEAAKAATLQYYNSEEALRDSIADLIRIVKTHAETTSNPNVYALAQIPAPVPPSPKPAPGQPTDIKVELLPGGHVSFKWKSTNASGGYFVIRRRPAGGDGGGAWTIAGTSDRRAFVDVSLPGGGGPWEYSIQGFRTSVAGPESEHLVVRLGSGGLQVASLAQFKMAA